jgi:hypothetical protein
MYTFNIIHENDGVWHFELNGINLLIDGFTMKDEQHYINTPDKAIAYFNLSGHLYGIANAIKTCSTVEGLYDIMRQQYKFFGKSA